MVAHGNAQFGVADPLLMLNDMKVKGVVLATLLQRTVIYGISKKPLHFLISPKDFSGKIIGVFGPPSTSFALFQNICKECNNINLSKPEAFEIEFTDELKYIQQPDIDVVLMTEPSASIAELEGAYRIFNGPKYFGKILNTGLFAKADYIEDSPKIVQRVVNALEKSLRFIHKEHLKTISVACEEFSEVPKSAVEFAMLRLLLDDVVPKNTIISDESLNALRRIREIDKPMQVIRSYVNNEFAVKANSSTLPSNEVFSLKPGMWGFSIDLKALWKNLQGR